MICMAGHGPAHDAKQHEENENAAKNSHSALAVITQSSLSAHLNSAEAISETLPPPGRNGARCVIQGLVSISPFSTMPMMRLKSAGLEFRDASNVSSRR